jgi:hypothetical protein
MRLTNYLWVLYFFWNKSNEKGVRLNHSTQNVKFVSLNSIVKNCFWWIGFMGFWHHLGNGSIAKKLVMAVVSFFIEKSHRKINQEKIH